MTATAYYSMDQTKRIALDRYALHTPLSKLSTTAILGTEESGRCSQR